MDINKIKRLFIEGSLDRIEKIKAKMEELKKGHENVKELLLDVYILAHGINSSSVFLPIKSISSISRVVEHDIKSWIDNGVVPHNHDVDDLLSEVDKLKLMIKDIDNYFGEGSL